MKCIPLFIAVVFSLFTVMSAQAAPDVKADLKENPDKIAAYNNYMRATMTEIRGLTAKNPDVAEKRIAEMEALLKGLKPTTQQAKTLQQRALRSAGFLKQNLELERTPLADFAKRLEANPDDLKALSGFYRKSSMKISPLARTQPDKAEKELKALKGFLDGVKAKAKNEATGRQIDAFARGMTSIERRIDAGRKHAGLIGANAVALDVGSWANGKALAAKDLKGKVVLLDFWAIWCGPCIATFPHLREWQDKYSDKGLVIIGLTRKYNYTWNEDRGRASRRAEGENTFDEEHEMLKQFAKHHKLKHVFAVQKDRSISDYYGVTGIPQVVLIDRQGKVRIIRVGSGEKNAHDVEAMIEKLIAQKANVASE